MPRWGGRTKLSAIRGGRCLASWNLNASPFTPCRRSSSHPCPPRSMLGSSAAPPTTGVLSPRRSYTSLRKPFSPNRPPRAQARLTGLHVPSSLLSPPPWLRGPLPMPRIPPTPFTRNATRGDRPLSSSFLSGDCSIGIEISIFRPPYHFLT